MIGIINDICIGIIAAIFVAMGIGGVYLLVIVEFYSIFSALSFIAMVIGGLGFVLRFYFKDKKKIPLYICCGFQIIVILFATGQL